MRTAKLPAPVARSPRPVRPSGETYHEQEARPRGRHRRRRPDRLRPAVPHRLRRNARQGPAGDPATAGDPRREGPEGAQGRDDGTGGLRLPAAGRHGSAQRPDGRLQGHRLRAAGRRPPARPRHGARRPAGRQRADLHRPGQGAGRLGQPQRQGAGGRQPGQHQRLHRDEERARPAARELHRHAAPGPQPRAEPDRRQDRQAGGVDPEAGRVGQPLAHHVRRLPLRHHRRRLGQGHDQRPGLEQGRVPAHRGQARRGHHRSARPVVGRLGRQRRHRPHARLGAGHRRRMGDDGRAEQRRVRHPEGRDVRLPGHLRRRQVQASSRAWPSTRSARAASTRPWPS